MPLQSTACQSDGNLRQACVSGLLASQKLLWPMDMWCKQDLETVYALLFQCLGKGTELALSSVSWVSARFWVVLVIDPIVFEPVGMGKLMRCDDEEQAVALRCDGCF